MNKFKNNFEYDMEDIRKQLSKKFEEISSKGDEFYAVVLHPETFRAILTDDNYMSIYRSISNNRQLFGFRVVMDLDMHLNEWNVLVRLQ